jgi:hypothetical protein
MPWKTVEISIKFSAFSIYLFNILCDEVGNSNKAFLCIQKCYGCAEEKALYRWVAT